MKSQSQKNLELDDIILAYHRAANLRCKPGVIKPPDFIGVGAGRCGTSTIYKILQTHPKIKLSPIKELNYFGISDVNTRRNGLTFMEYQTYFATDNIKLLRGEISPAYLTNIRSLEQIKHFIPNVKIIVTLRDYFDRFISQYKHHQKESGFKDFNLYCKEAILNYEVSSSAKGWFTPWKNLEQSLYYKGLKFINQNFSTSQVYLSLFNNLKLSSSNECNKICNFLNLEDFNFSPVKENKSNDLVIPSIDSGLKRQLDEIFSKDLTECVKLYPKLSNLTL